MQIPLVEKSRRAHAQNAKKQSMTQLIIITGLRRLYVAGRSVGRSAGRSAGRPAGRLGGRLGGAHVVSGAEKKII